jgi:hypothetical protein
MIDGDEKRLDSGVASLPSTFRNFVRGWEAWCLELPTIHSFVEHSSRYREDLAEMISNSLLIQSMVTQFRRSRDAPTIATSVSSWKDIESETTYQWSIGNHQIVI